MKYSRLRGVKDIYGADSFLWQKLIASCALVFDKYNYTLIIPPTIEDLALFTRGIGEGSDIVIKEMYNFKDKGDRDIALRPEGTASVTRAYIENSMPEKSSFYYMGQMFRYERPQTGRYREFFQIGAECFGDASPMKDAEVIMLSEEIIKTAGINSYELNINNLGAKPGYRDDLMAFLNSKTELLCEDCKRKAVRAPLRVLDCKNPKCREATAAAPLITNNLSEEAGLKYNEIKKILTEHGVKFRENPAMVRGLDYYTGTVFEFVTDKLGPQQNTILAGGRYDNLVEELGGRKTPATGFALGIERMVEVMKAEGAGSTGTGGVKAFIVYDKNYALNAFALLKELREAGIKSSMSFDEKSFKAQFREADSKGAQYVIIIGEAEAAKNIFSVKKMATGDQKEYSVKEMIKEITGG